MKNILIFIIGLALGFFALKFYLLHYAVKDSPKLLTGNAKPTPTGFSIVNAPAKSLKGKISSWTGSILWEPRTATEPATLDSPDNIIIQQGERVLTATASGALVVFDNSVSLKIDEKTDISFVQTLPAEFVLEQKTGSVSYEIQGAIPLSIRLRNALITKQSGKIRISLRDNDPIISISQIEGPTKIGFNDRNRSTQIFTLREGEAYEYDSDKRTAINIKNK